MLLNISNELYDNIIEPQLLNLDGSRHCELRVVQSYPHKNKSSGDELHGMCAEGMWQERVRLEFKKGHRQPYLDVVMGQLIIRRQGKWMCVGGESADTLGHGILKSIIDLP